eukprot:gene11060-13078_t
MLSIGMPELLGTAFFLAAPLLSLVDLEGIYHVRFTAQRQSQRGIRLMCAVVVAKMCLMRFRERHRSGAASLIQQAFRTHLAYQGLCREGHSECGLEVPRAEAGEKGGVERGTSGHVLPSTHVVHFVKTWRQRHARRLRERQAAARAIQYSQQHQHYMVQRRMHEPLWSAQHTGLGRDTREGSEEARTPLVVESYTSDLEEDLEQRNSVTGRRIRDRAAGVVVESDCVSSFRAACHGASEAESTVGETETDGFLSSTPFELGRAPASDGEARYWLSDTEADTDREVDSMMDMALTHRIQAALRTRGLSITNK